MSLHTVFERPQPADAAREAVVVLEDVWVRYRIPHERFGSLKEYAIQRLRGRRPTYEDYWALQGVTLAVPAGEVTGIVGRNGAGKSTLLKVVARVLRPTRGRVRVVGRVAPLLELGAGFHPELTGRENVFLNATLLGHSHREIRMAFDDIVTFAGLREFIDAPLRTYSSGMVARLGFAVATAWQPEILILDEVLAVGDEAFQRLCRARLEAFARNGTTVLLVSHSAQTVREMCRRAFWLERGRLAAAGDPATVTAQYQQALAMGGP